MSATTETYINGSAPTVDAAAYNGFKLENNNFIEGSGQTLNTSDRQQTHKAAADFSANGDFYTGSGSADTYAANPVSPREGIHALQNGMQIRFVVPATNTGASTLNVNSLGVKDLKNWDGSALVGSELVQGEIVTVIYISSPGEWRLINRNSLLSLVVPIGTVIPWMDYNGAVAFDSNYWAYMDGSVLSDAHSPLNGETLTDLSGRYLVGFGTDGGGDIDSALWSVSPVGNAGHEVDLEHKHWIGERESSANLYRLSFFDINGATIEHSKISSLVAVTGGGGYFDPDTSVTAYTQLYSKNAGSATTDIQPSSIPCRFLIRIK